MALREVERERERARMHSSRSATRALSGLSFSLLSMLRHQATRRLLCVRVSLCVWVCVCVYAMWMNARST